MFRGILKPFVCVIFALLLFGALSSRPVEAFDDFEFTGTISSLPNTQGFIGDWTVAGRTVHVTSTTEIDQDAGSPAVGKSVEVEGVLQNDGAVTHHEIA